MVKNLDVLTYRIKSFALLNSIVENGKDALDTARYNLSNALFVCFFQQIINYKNKAIQRKGVEANGANSLHPVKTPGAVCQ